MYVRLLTVALLTYDGIAKCMLMRGVNIIFMLLFHSFDCSDKLRKYRPEKIIWENPGGTFELMVDYSNKWISLLFPAFF